MSVVTGIMLVLGLGEEDGQALEQVQDWLESAGLNALSDVSDHASGNKHPQFLAMAAGYNYFPDGDAFARFVLERDWHEPERVVLTIQPEHGDAKVYRPNS